MTTKLWQTEGTASLHPLVETYTVGDDLAIDQKLLGYDIMASIAHVTMMSKVGIIPKPDGDKIARSLRELHALWLKGKYTIPDAFEDGHSAIEWYLTDTLGPVGKKVHTGRSRNDQALVMMRLYVVDMLEAVAKELQQVIYAFKQLAKKNDQTPMPGYTHTQKAMPTTVAAYAGSFVDAFKDQLAYIEQTTQLINQNPLGSAAGFGSSLPLDRERTTELLRFIKTQENPLYCGLSRGIFELMSIQSITPAMTFAGKFANDMLFFTSNEIAYFSLPTTLTTGSSIMPHKRNYDVCEIMRAKAQTFSAYSLQLQQICSNVGSGYHRDLQLTKALSVHAFDDALSTFKVLALVVHNLKADWKKLKASMTDEIYLVDNINELVKKGVPFRDAYQEIKASLKFEPQ